MGSAPHHLQDGRRPARRRLAIAGAAVMLGVAGAVAAVQLVPASHPRRAAEAPPLVVSSAPVVPSSPAAATTPPAAATTPPAAPAPRGLPVIDYWTAPHGFPADPAAGSVAPATEGLHPTRSLAVYDAPGGRPRARLKPAISGLPVTVPIVERRSGWFAVLLPTANRTIGWLPAGGWVSRPLPDHLIVRLRTHRLTWLRNGVQQAAWQVSTGTRSTPTPLGRTFVLGRTATSGSVYAGVDALALGAVPDDPSALSAGLRDGHTGIHGWYDKAAFGRSASNGCIRMPKAAQQVLLHHIAPGTLVTVTE